MAKYDPLQVYLEGLPAGTQAKTLTFAKIEQILGPSLPATAHRYREWWANETPPTSHVQALAWIESGWRVDVVNQDEEWVRFGRA